MLARSLARASAAAASRAWMSASFDSRTCCKPRVHVSARVRCEYAWGTPHGGPGTQSTHVIVLLALAELLEVLLLLLEVLLEASLVLLLELTRDYEIEYVTE